MLKQPKTPEERKVILQKHQNLKMAESAHAYVRGNTARFYDWVQSDSVRSSLPQGPDIWICGDCHTGNLGPVANVEGKIDVQIRDLDQTVIGNPAHDLLRLGLSLAMAARSSDLPGVTTALMLEEMISGYLTTLTGHTAQVKAEEIEPLRPVLKEAESRRWKHLAQERMEDATPTIPIGRKFWPLTKEEQAELRKMFHEDEVSGFVDCLLGSGKKKQVDLLDAAYWMKGCSSLGRLRYAVLISIGKNDREYRLLDVKQATAATAPHSSTAKMPVNNAERVVTGARHLSPYLGERMVAASHSGRQVVIRELRPQDLKFELARLKQAEAIAIARLMAGVVGRAHGRQLKQAERRSWAVEIKKRHSRDLDAPRWLWSAVLDLAALHEAAYLEHCRRYALGQN